MPRILSGLLLGALMVVMSIANAEFSSNDNDGFTLPPKPKKPLEQKVEENDGIKRPDAAKVNPSVSNQRPSKDEDFNADLLDGVKRPKNGN